MSSNSSLNKEQSHAKPLLRESEDEPDLSALENSMEKAVNATQQVSDNYLLYLSHFLQTFGDRMWQFSIPILFTLIFSNTILPQSIYAFSTFLALIVFMPLFGVWIDSNTNKRLKVVAISIVIQNIMIIISCILLYLMSFLLNDIHSSNIFGINYKMMTIFIGLLITSMIGEVMGKGTKMALEKDWVYNLFYENKNVLTVVNSRMKRIDLFCKIIAPASFGLFLQYISNDEKLQIQYSAYLILIWNIIGLFAEIITIKMFYDKNKALLTKVYIDRKKKLKTVNICHKLYNGWLFWIKSNIFLASIAYCSVYVNVLNGGSLVTAYLRFTGLSFTTLGIAKGFGAILGIIGTIITPFLHNKLNISMESIGLIGIWFFFICIAIGAIEFIFNEITSDWFDIFSLSSSYLILFGMILARCPLWIFDISENQLLQIHLPKDILSHVSGVQMSMSNVFYLSLTVFGMIFHDVSDFHILVYYALCVVGIGAVLYSIWHCGLSHRLHSIESDNNNEKDLTTKLVN